MKIKVKFYLTFREIFEMREKEVLVKDGDDVRTLLNGICETFSQRKAIFVNENLNPYIVVLKNGRHIQFLAGLGTKLSEGDKIAIFPPIQGG
jgi:MoaD family protein